MNKASFWKYNRQRITVLSWIIYDFANSIFPAAMTGLYFSLWVIQDNKIEDVWYSLTLSSSMIIAAVTLPLMGAFSDQKQRRMPFLVGYTFSCIALIALIGLVDRLFPPSFSRGVLGLILFALANCSFQGCTVFYNTLLPLISNSKTMGKISGLGVAAGYLGTVVGLMVVTPFVEGEIPFLNWKINWLTTGSRGAAFIPTALFFLVFSLPLFFFVREGNFPHSQNITEFSRLTWKSFRQRLLKVRKYPSVVRFLTANFLFEDAITTLTAFAAIYAQMVLGVSDSLKVLFLIIFATFAILGSILSGFIADRVGARNTLVMVLIGWIFSVGIAVSTRNLPILGIMGALIGIFLGATWTVTRPFLIELSPPEMLGEFFGLYSLSGRFASMIGPLIWGAVVTLAKPLGVNRYRLAVVTLIVLLIAGLKVLWGVPSYLPRKNF